MLYQHLIYIQYKGYAALSYSQTTPSAFNFSAKITTDMKNKIYFQVKSFPGLSLQGEES